MVVAVIKSIRCCGAERPKPDLKSQVCTWTISPICFLSSPGTLHWPSTSALHTDTHRMCAVITGTHGTLYPTVFSCVFSYLLDFTAICHPPPHTGVFIRLRVKLQTDIHLFIYFFYRLQPRLWLKPTFDCGWSYNLKKEEFNLIQAWAICISLTFNLPTSWYFLSS